MSESEERKDAILRHRCCGAMKAGVQANGMEGVYVAWGKIFFSTKFWSTETRKKVQASPETEDTVVGIWYAHSSAISTGTPKLSAAIIKPLEQEEGVLILKSALP